MITNDILTQGTIDAFLAKNPFLTSKQIDALYKINSYSSNPLIQNNFKNPLVFFFEGAGYSIIPTASLYDDKPSIPGSINYKGYRYGAMVVVVQGGNIKGIYQNATTLPDQPKGNSCNGGRDVPTLRPGVYKIIYITHGKGKDAYAALHIVGEDYNVVRFDSTQWYLSRSDKIYIHKSTEPINGVEYFSIAQTDIWSISAGSLLVAVSEYTSFSMIIGFDKNGNGLIDLEDKISGCAIIDRSLMDANRVDLLYLYGNDGLSLIMG